jgi:hypothetical protein
MKGDFAYDTFLRWDNAKGNPQLEVMVWAGHNSWPIGNCTGYNVLWNNNISWDIWEGYNDAAGYYVYSFVPNGTVVWPENSLPTSGSMNVDLKPFYQWLQNNRSGDGRYNNNMYLDVVEAGFEVVQGNGWAYINGWIDAQKGGSGGISSGSTYKIIARHSGKALEAGGNSTVNGTQIQQWDYVGSASQQWVITDTGSGNYKLIGVQSGKALDIDYSQGGTANGTKVQLWDFWSGPSQLYKFTATTNGYYRISPNCATGSCLDVYYISTTNGAPVKLCQWNGGNNQQWLLQPVDGTAKLISKYSGKSLCAYGGQTANGTQIHQWDYINSSYTDQQWTLTDTGSGNYKFINVKSGRALDIDGGKSANDTKIQLYDSNGATAQRYKLTSSEVGQFRISPNCATGSCLDVSGPSTANGTKIHLWQWLNADNQKWSVQAP